MNAGDRYRHRASGRVVELVAPVSHTSGVILRPQDRAWSCRIVAGNGCATRIQERTLRRAWDLVPAVPPTAPEPPQDTP